MDTDIELRILLFILLPPKVFYHQLKGRNMHVCFALTNKELGCRVQHSRLLYSERAWLWWGRAIRRPRMSSSQFPCSGVECEILFFEFLANVRVCLFPKNHSLYTGPEWYSSLADIFPHKNTRFGHFKARGPLPPYYNLRSCTYSANPNNEVTTSKDEEIYW